ncbi:hypothetical protein HDE68_002285 [Pedobacter cryoconitis]|uniref:Lipoprotein n=1 Tax=Pedobacter cryoconitis TaxID=188932 RepID=A0A7W9DZM0_9SPHI|nr:hypothetical protein [Pedobacter cryoconitis]MBB5636384.1 hypothetical protein [Pedobacter cryoconitis]
MKKILLGLSFIGLLFYSCQSKEKQKIQPSTTDHKVSQQVHHKLQTDSVHTSNKVDYLNEIP